MHTWNIPNFREAASFLYNVLNIACLKVHGMISHNGGFYSNDASSPKKSWFQKPFGYMKRLHIIIAIDYNLLCIKLNYGFHY